MKRDCAGYYTAVVDGTEYTVYEIQKGEWVYFRSDNQRGTMNDVFYSKRDAVKNLYLALELGLIGPGYKEE